MREGDPGTYTHAPYATMRWRGDMPWYILCGSTFTHAPYATMRWRGDMP